MNPSALRCTVRPIRIRVVKWNHFSSKELSVAISPQPQPLQQTGLERRGFQKYRNAGHKCRCIDMLSITSCYWYVAHFSNFIGFLSNGGYSLSWLPLPTKSYTPVLRHICLNASISTFLLAPCDHPSALTCTSLALIFISVHARFILQLQPSGILFLLLFVRLKP